MFRESYPEVGTDSLFRKKNKKNYHYSLLNYPEERSTAAGEGLPFPHYVHLLRLSLQMYCFIAHYAIVLQL
jgi:hypothetical protein